MEIEADSVELDLNREATRAQGHARLAYGPLELHADEVTADRQTGEISAAGGLALVHSGRTLQGDDLHYNLRTEQGSLANATVAEQGLIIRGQRIDLSPQEVVAHDAFFTTCDRPDAHFSLSADTITLTAQQTQPGGQPQSGRLTLDRGRVTYRGRRLFTLPRYSVQVGQIGEPSSSPFPASGFDREDGPYAQISYTLGRTGDPTVGSFSYRYTSFRGIRGHLKLSRQTGPLDLAVGYVRRETATDRELQPEDLTNTLSSIMVNREPEFTARLADVPLTPFLNFRGEAIWGAYSESEEFEADTRAKADRTSLSGLLSSTPYYLSPGLALSHAIGLRRSSYSSGDQLTIRYFRHTLSLAPGRDTSLALSYSTRRGSGATPFLFDTIGAGRELFADLRLRLTPRWKLRLVDVYDLDLRDTRDMILSLTRTVHCLDYTIGWRKSRGSFFIGINLAPLAQHEPAHTSAEEGGHD